jgi:hypothetical protein
MTDKEIEEQASKKARGLQKALAERGVSTQVYHLRAGECQLIAGDYIIGYIWKGVDCLYCVRDGTELVRTELVNGNKAHNTLDQIASYAKPD